MAQFLREAIEKHIRKHHSGCPDFAVAHFADKVSERDWRGVTPGRAVGIVMQTFTRHEMTNYNQLLLEGVDREEARRRVQCKINRMLNSWRRKPVDASRT